MTAQQLKNSILQMAVQGKLVPQDPNDEPASVLLERIRKEKQQLIKEGKIKKEKNPSVIFRGADNTPYEKIGDAEPVSIADEVPFDIPDSWAWIRLGMISTYAQPKKKISAKDADPNMWGLDLEDIEKGGRLLAKHTVGERKAIGDKTFFEKGDVLYSKLRPYLLKILVAKEDGICTPEIVPFKVYGNIDAEYIVAYLQCPYVDSLINAATYGIKMPRAGTETMTSLLIPVPPLSEQGRIVDKIKQLMPYIELYNTKEQALTFLNETFPEQLKKSILQMAVQGKLIPQDPSDEPASVLLEHIHTEKERLIKEGKIKRDKNESVIFRRDNSHYEKRDGVEVCIDGDIPYDIPDSWGWVRLNNICRIVNGFTPLRSNPDYWDNGTIPWFTVDDIHSQGRRIHKTAQKITSKALGKDSNRILPPQTVLLCCTASVGEYAISEIALTTNQQFNGLVINDVWKDIYDPEFLLILVQTFKDRLLTVAGKTTFNFVSVKKLGDLVVPVLSLQEQMRIIEAVNNALPIVDAL